jgi:hypothetical protein
MIMVGRPKLQVSATHFSNEFKYRAMVNIHVKLQINATNTTLHSKPMKAISSKHYW